MSEAKNSQLSERQEMLLSAYADGECSAFSRFMAKRLLQSNEQARLFLNQLHASSQTFKSFTNAHEPADLWGRISARIEAEQRAAQFLGGRATETAGASESFISRFLSRHAVIGGFSGAAVAAMVLVLVTRPTKPGEILPVFTDGPVAAQHASPFHQAAFGGQNSARALAPQSKVEVDWMRARGPLQVIESPHDRSAVIWVRKHPPVLSGTGTPAFPTPTIRVLPNEELPAQPLRQAK